MTRCPWCDGDPLYVKYHDEEWGVPLHDDRRLFEALILDGAQAGLSWLTILRKRENYRASFDRFNPEKVARYGPREIRRLMTNAGIVRNKLKIESAIANARALLAAQAKFGTFDKYLWQFVAGEPIQNRWRRMSDIPTQSRESEMLSRDLKQRHFTFVGPTICYAMMQGVGMVNDHLVGCFRHGEVKSR